MFLDIKGIRYEVPAPNTCPHCHIVHYPAQDWIRQTEDIDDHIILLSAWRCTNNDCGRYYVVQHKLYEEGFEVEYYLNGLPKGPDWPVIITSLQNGNTINSGSSGPTKFIKTYLQSLSAENEGLDEIAGMGYRKAIEYLVKDYAINTNSQDKEKIEGLWLGQVISTYYQGDLREILERATWLGNDQSHYNKLFNEFDIDILKELIDLIVVELDREHKKKHYIAAIQRRK